MGKKVKEYKTGDFIFAKVKGYPAWPARVQSFNGKNKKYLVYFYGTGETANLPPNMIFDYAENKDKFLSKAVKRRDFNEGVQQIAHDFTNNVPLEDIIGAVQAPVAGNDTMEDSAIDTTAAGDTTADTTAANDTAVDDSDEAGALVIDEGKQQTNKGRKSKAPEPAKTPKTPATPRVRGKGLAPPRGDTGGEEEGKEEIVSRSGRKIRPKRYLDEQTEENATLPSPAPKKKRGASPATEKETPTYKETEKKEKEKPAPQTIKSYNNVPRSELEELKEPFKPENPDNDNILIAYLPSGQYVGVKLFQNRPKTMVEAARLKWDRQNARNALRVAHQLERGDITPQSVSQLLTPELILTDEERATLDKQRESEEKKYRMQFLKTEMRLIELDAKIKTCLCLEHADTETCLTLLDQLTQLDVKPLMLLKHPTCLETVKRMRAYVGNTPSWDFTDQQALTFSQQALRIRKGAHLLYKGLKDLFPTPEGVSFWEYFSGQVLQFKQATAALGADQLLEMVHPPLELSMPSAVTMVSAAAADPPPDIDTDAPNNDTDHQPAQKKARTKKPTNNTTPPKQTARRHSARRDKGPDSDGTADTTDGAVGSNPEKEPELPVNKGSEVTQPTESGPTNEGAGVSDAPPTEGENETENADTIDKDSEKPGEQGKTETDISKDETQDKQTNKQVTESKDSTEKPTTEKPKRNTRSKKNSEREDDHSDKKETSVKETNDKNKTSEKKTTTKKHTSDKEETSTEETSYKKESSDKKTTTKKHTSDKEETSTEETSYKKESSDKKTTNKKHTSDKEGTSTEEANDKQDTNDKETSDKNKTSAKETSDKKANSDKNKDTEKNKKSKDNGHKDEQSETDKDSDSGKSKEKNSEKVKENSEKVKESSEKAKESSDNAKESSDSGNGEEKEKEDEPRAKRSRGENKKADPPAPRPSLQRKSKA